MPTAGRVSLNSLFSLPLFEDKALVLNIEGVPVLVVAIASGYPDDAPREPCELQRYPCKAEPDVPVIPLLEARKPGFVLDSVFPLVDVIQPVTKDALEDRRLRSFLGR